MLATARKTSHRTLAISAVAPRCRGTDDGAQLAIGQQLAIAHEITSCLSVVSTTTVHPAGSSVLVRNA